MKYVERLKKELQFLYRLCAFLLYETLKIIPKGKLLFNQIGIGYILTRKTFFLNLRWSYSLS